VEEGSGDYSLASELFMELAGETRFSILVSLSKKPAKLSSLSREMDITVQDVHRNLNRLMQEGLVNRSDGTFHMTEYGTVVMKQVSGLLVVKKHRKFFEDHGLAGAIPDKFLQRIGALYACKAVSSVTAVLQTLKKLESSASKSIKVMVAQAWPEEGEIFIDKASRGIEILALTGYNTIVPRNVTELIGPRLEELAAKGIFRGRMVEKISVAIYIADESEAALMLPNSKGEVDMNTMFLGSDPVFCEWCADLFDYMWNRSRPLNTKKLRVVEY